MRHVILKLAFVALFLLVVAVLVGQAVLPDIPFVRPLRLLLYLGVVLVVIVAKLGRFLPGIVRNVRVIVKLGSAAWMIVVMSDLISQAVMRNGIHQKRLAIDLILSVSLLLFGIIPSVSDYRKHFLQFAPLAISIVTIFAAIYWYEPRFVNPPGRTWIDILPLTAWFYLFAHLAEVSRIPKPALGMSLLILDACIKWPSDVGSFVVLIVMGSVVALWLNGQREPRRPLKLNEPSAVNQR